MEIINHDIDYDLNIEKYFDNEPVCFLDIETTGFNRVTDTVYLVGLLTYNDKKYVLKQYFLNSPEKEDILLQNLIDDIEKIKYLVTFNGNSFDIPFLNSKYKKHNIDYQISKNNSIDIYRIIRKNKEVFPLKSLKLKSIEKYLGINREDTMSGKDCIYLYYDYVDTKNEEKRKLVLKHNYDDLYYLPYILEVLDIIDEKKSIYISSTIFDNENDLKIKIQDIDFTNNIMKVTCNTSSFKKDSYIKYGSYYNLDWNINKGLLNIEFQINEGLLSTEEKAFYLDLDNFEHKISITDCTSFKLPKNIILLKINKKLIVDNIKNIINSIIEYLFTK